MGSSLPTVASIRSPNMKLQCLVCFLAILPQFSNGKNYHLVNDEKSASEYVYGLFGLTNVVDKGLSGLSSIKNKVFGTEYDLGRNQITQQRPKYQSSDNLKYDVLQASTVGCDVVVFLVFNDFSTGQNTDGHKYSGFATGAPCEASQASGYTVIVDQGFYEDVWMGPQILAHHLLLMLTADLFQPNDPRRYCTNEYSLLHKNIKAGEQYIDQCIIDMLNNSDISIRQCSLDF